MAFVPPTVRVFMACWDVVHRDDGRLFLDTPVHTLQFDDYPVKLPALWFYAQMSGVVADVDLTVVMREFDTGIACAGPSKPLHVNRNDSPLDVVEARLGLFGFPIDAPNSYEFALLINGHEVENGLYRVNAYD
jgi:hypothetical protein